MISLLVKSISFMEEKNILVYNCTKLYLEKISILKMRIRQLRLQGFKRFHDLTIDLGESPKRIIALVGPNGCGKSCVFDAFEVEASKHKGGGGGSPSFYSKGVYSEDIKEGYVGNKAVQIIAQSAEHAFEKKSFLIRSPYRFTSKLDVKAIHQKPDVLEDQVRPKTSAELDNRLPDNYERLFSNWIADYGNRTIDKPGWKIQDELLSKINEVLDKVLEIRISSLGNVTNQNEGKLFFEKGPSKKLPYENLSAGEKEVVDIVLDLIVKARSFDDTVYCIDEPELHLNSAIQRRLLLEINELIPENCQLWIATHSIGFLRALQEELKEESQIINFSEHNFDSPTPVTLEPMLLTREKWKSIFSTALDDLTGLLAPKRIIYCEGRADTSPSQGHIEKGVDAIVYNTIFGEEFHDTHFVSSGGQTQPDKGSEFAIMVLSKALNEVQILLLKDKDINSDGREMTDEQRKGWLSGDPCRRMLKRKEIENYLFDFEVISAAYPEVTKEQYTALIKDCCDPDVKEKAGDLKSLCGVGNSMNKEGFKIYLSKFFNRKMGVYKELKDCIFHMEQSLLNMNQPQ